MSWKRKNRGMAGVTGPMTNSGGEVRYRNHRAATDGHALGYPPQITRAKKAALMMLGLEVLPAGRDMYRPAVYDENHDAMAYYSNGAECWLINAFAPQDERTEALREILDAGTHNT